MLRVSSRAVAGWLLAVGVVGTALVGACADPKGAIMLAVNTDMKAPKDVNAVSVTISTNGAIKHSFIGRVTPQGEVLLPATLAIVEPEDKSASIRIRVMAFQNRKPRVLRDVRTTVPQGGRTALLRIPLNFVNDNSAVGEPLPAQNVLPDPIPGTGGTSSSGGTSGSSGAPGSSGTSGGASSGGAGSGVGSAADFDFFGAYQPPCDDIQNQTIIDGECKDNYVDPETLPDFDGGGLGDSTDQGTCFDLAKCFAGAVGVGEGEGGGMVQPAPDAGTAPPDGDAGRGEEFDAGKGFKFKDYGIRPSAVTLDRGTCSLQLNGANASRLNLALITPETGECVRPGECYVPIDRGAGGWKEENGRVQLPTFVCKLLNKDKLRLATSTEVCAAKEESNPICTPKLGEPVPPGVDNGSVLVVPEDYATAVVAQQGTLYFASASRVGQLNLFDATAKGTALLGITVPPGTRVPWRFSNAQLGGALALANGQSEGFVLGSGADVMVTRVSIANGTIDVAGISGAAGQLAWAMHVEGQGGIYTSSTSGVAVKVNLPITDATAILGLGSDKLLIGDGNGMVRQCDVVTKACFPPGVLSGGGRVDAYAARPDQSGGYVLASSGIYGVGSTGTSTPQLPLFVMVDTSGIDEGSFHYSRAMAVNNRCLFFTSMHGVDYALHGTAAANRVNIAPSPPGAQILGLALGPQQGTGEGGPDALYYTVFAPREQGGGVWRVPVPAACSDAAINPDAGPKDSGTAMAMCGPATCSNGCCASPFTCVTVNQTNATCGSGGANCAPCTLPDVCMTNPQGGECIAP